MPFDETGGRAPALNVLGGRLESCSMTPLTGFFRNGCCNTGPEDHGSHTVCAVLTAAFLTFSAGQGNDLSTPRPEYGFPGLVEGDKWCLCVTRWHEALVEDMAPRVSLAASHISVLEFVDLDDLKEHALDIETGES